METLRIMELVFLMSLIIVSVIAIALILFNSKFYTREDLGDLELDYDILDDYHIDLDRYTRKLVMEIDELHDIIDKDTNTDKYLIDIIKKAYNYSSIDLILSEIDILGLYQDYNSKIRKTNDNLADCMKECEHTFKLIMKENEFRGRA